MANQNQNKRKNFCPIESLSKMRVWFKDGSRPATFYSFLAHDNKSPEKGIESLEKLLFSDKMKNRWKTAVIYNNRGRGEERRKWVDGKRVFKKIWLQ